jgi:hypothetical protein
LFSAVVGPDGAVSFDDPAGSDAQRAVLLAAECPIAYELTRPSPL